MGQQPKTAMPRTTGDRSMELAALIARLEKATGPDRAIDFEIWSVLDPEGISQRAWPHELKMPWDQWFENWKHDPRAFMRYTASIDAALTLVPPLVWLEIETGTQREGDPQYEWPIVACGPQRTGDVVWRGQAKSLPLALCIAALKARLATTTGERSPVAHDPSNGRSLSKNQAD